MAIITIGLWDGPPDLREILRNLSSRQWTLLAAIVFGVGGILTAVLVTMVFFIEAPFSVSLAISAGFAPRVAIGGFTLGGVFWWFLVERRRSYSNGRGALVGALTGLLAHYAMSLVDYLWIIGIAETQPLLMEALVTYIVRNGTFTLIFAGLITVPAGAVIGDLLVKLRRGSLDGPSAESGDDIESE